MKMKFEPVRKLDLKKLDLTVDEQLKAEVGAVIITSAIRNILNQKQGSGAPLKRNAASTRANKVRKGTGSKSLIDEQHRFVSPSNYRVSGTKQVIVVHANAELEKLMGWTRALGYIGWEKPDKRGQAGVKAALWQWIERKFKKLRGGF